MQLETVKYEKQGHIARITLNRPESLNACNLKMFEEMPKVWADFKSDTNMRVAILTGAGDKAFCTGLDLKQTASQGSEPEALQMGNIRLSPRQNDVFKPVICAINGIICGGGFHFYLGSDIIICSENATFFDTHTSIGFVAHREAIGLSRRIGYNHAIRFALMGRYDRISAERAYDIGLVTEVVPIENLLTRANEIAETLLKNAPKALEGSVEAMWRSQNLGLEDAWKLSGLISRQNFLLEDALEGPRAFSEKRQPNWKGR